MTWFREPTEKMPNGLWCARAVRVRNLETEAGVMFEDSTREGAERMLSRFLRAEASDSEAAAMLNEALG